MDVTLTVSSPRQQASTMVFDSRSANDAAAREREFREVLEELRQVRIERQALLDQQSDATYCKSTLALREVELSAAQAELRRAQAEGDACRASCVTLEAERRQVQSDHNAKMASLSAAHERELSATRAQLLAVQAERDSQLTQRNQELETAKKELLLLKAEGEGHRVAFDWLEDELGKSRVAFDETSGLLAVSQRKVDALLAQVQTQDNDLSARLRDIELARRECEAHRLHADSVKADLQLQKCEHEALALRHTEAVHQADGLKRELGDMRTSCETHRVLADAAKADLQLQKSEHEALALRHTEAVRLAGDLKRELVEVRATCESQRSAAEKARQELQALQKDHSSQGETLLAVKRRAADHEAECKRLLETVESRDSDLLKVQNELAEANAERERYLSDAQRLETDLRSQQGNCAALEAELARSRSEQDAHKNLATEAQRRAEVLAAKCDHLDAALANASARQADFAIERTLHKERADKLEEGNDKLRLDLEVASRSPEVDGRHTGFKLLESTSAVSTHVGSPASTAPPSPRSLVQVSLPPTSPTTRSPKAKIDQSRSAQAHVRVAVYTSSD